MACALLAFGSLVGGCDSDPISGGSCVTNQECPLGEQCVGGKCIPAVSAGCKNDDACEIGEYCDPIDSTCKTIEIVGCSTDEACPPHQRCNTLTGVCIDGRRNCQSEADCANINKHCDLTIQQCVDCLGPEHCTPPQVCTEGVCTDPQQNNCSGDPECNPPSTICESQQCVPGCGTTGCNLGMVCNSQTGRCEQGQVTCSDDPECNPPATICESSQCIPGCTQVGGLQCTGGYVCNPSTGRCEPPTGCLTDPECGPPAAVCEAGACVPGCGQPGGIPCGTGTVCDTNTGRCVVVQGPCNGDPDCNPPVTVCEVGQCVGGCGEVGGIQCTGNTVCNTSTGRCEPGTPVCTSDSQCNPPSTICNTQTGNCDPGCPSTGCTTPFVCNAQTGHCYDPGSTTGAALNAACTIGSDCQSGVCFDFEGSIGMRCVAACGNSMECPADFTCYDFNGGKMCISSQLFTGASFATPNGGGCSAGGDCHSNFCPDEGGSRVCVDSCSEDSDCSGSSCKWWEFSTDYYIASCNGPAGSGSNGSTCTTESECRGGVCYGSGVCGDLCGSTVDCPSGNVCYPVNYSVCTMEIGICLAWAPYYVKACVQVTHGQGAVGSPCSDGSSCRSALCHTTVGMCTDTCSRSSDCPATHVCGVELFDELSDGTSTYANVCIPK